MPEPYWTNRLCRPDDTGALLDLFRTVYSDRYLEIDRTYWEWRYQTDTACSTGVFMAELDGHPIGVLPMAVFDFQWHETRLTGAMICGLVTHPDHRRRGIFRSLVGSVVERTVDLGVPFIMGIPNDPSLPGYFKFGGWHYFGDIQLCLKIADGRAVLQTKLGRGLANLVGWAPQVLFRRPRGLGSQRLRCERVTLAPDDLDEVFEEFARDCGALMIRRTAAYWNWRYGTKPNAPYCSHVTYDGNRLMGAVVTTVQQYAGLSVGVIIDLVTRGRAAGARQLLQCAEDELRSRGVGLITCLSSSPMLQRALRDEGYWCPNPALFPKQFHYIYRPTDVPGLPRQPTQLTDWYLTFGDWDNI